MTATEVRERQQIPAAIQADPFGPLASLIQEKMSESILQEAQRLTHGPRRADYGHPLDDYSRTAAIATALLSHKLRDGEQISAADMALLMVGVKLSRQVNHPKRDNMVDAAGYAWVAQECHDEAGRRQNAQISTTETK